jgi:hypothetical protein
LPGRFSLYTPCHVVMNGTPVRRAATRADHAGARLRACTSVMPCSRISRASGQALIQMLNGSFVISGSATCCPPARSTCATMRPPALATTARPPARTTA